MIPKSLAKKNTWRIYRSDLVDPEKGVYMKRWIFQTPWFGIRIHKICQSDSGRELHDHPFDFTSFILWGGYRETNELTALGLCNGEYLHGAEWHGPGSFVRHKASDMHRLELQRPAWTLVFAGPYRRNWGFRTGGDGWTDFESYHRSFYGGDWRKDRIHEDG